MAVDDRSDDAGEVPAYHPGGKVPQEDRRFTPGYAQQVAAEQAAKRREFEKKIEAMRNRAADAQGESAPEARRPDAPASGGAASAEPDGQVLRSAPRNAPLPRDSAPSPANPLPRGGDSPRPPSAGRSGASPRAQAGAVQAARWSRETIAAALVWLLALAVVIAIVVLETIPSGSARNAEGGATSSTGATSPSSPTMTYSPVNWPTKVPSPSPAPGADGVTKVNDLDVTYLGINLDATSQVAPYGNVPDYGKKVVGIKLRVKNSKDSSITMIGYRDGFHVVLHLNVGSERSRSRDKGPDALWDGSSLPSGQTKEGWVYVEVPQEYKGGYLSYETMDDIDTSILVQ